MIDIRRLISEGHSYTSIQEVLGLERRTFYRLLNRTFAEDQKALSGQNEQELMRQLSILRTRYNEQYQLLHRMAQDEKLTATDRVNILTAMKLLSDSIMRLHFTSPTLTLIQARKIEAARTGQLVFDDLKARLPATIFQWPPFPSSYGALPILQEEESAEVVEGDDDEEQGRVN